MNIKKILLPALLVGIVCGIISEFTYCCGLHLLEGFVAVVLLFFITNKEKPTLFDSLICGALTGLVDGIAGGLTSAILILLNFPLEPEVTGMQQGMSATEFWSLWFFASIIVAGVFAAISAAEGLIAGFLLGQLRDRKN